MVRDEVEEKDDAVNVTLEAWPIVNFAVYEVNAGNIFRRFRYHFDCRSVVEIRRELLMCCMECWKAHFSYS